MKQTIKRPRIAITIGDAAGIGPEIVLKAMQSESLLNYCQPIIIGNIEVLQFYRELLKINVKFHEIKKVNEAIFEKGTIDILNIDDVVVPEIIPGMSHPQNGEAMLKYAECAVKLALNKKVDAVIGGPHTKESVELAGIKFDGYPRFVAQLTDTHPERTFLMLIAENLRIVNVTLHVPLRDALNMLTKELIYDSIISTSISLKGLGINSPKIAVAGLNPHAGEGGLMGREEIDIISPAINKAREEGINVEGPFSPDTMLLDYQEQKYDAYVAMYHDQAHIPIKALSFGKISAQTIGVPITFCTVGHGSAPDIAGKGIASSESLIRTVSLLSKQ